MLSEQAQRTLRESQLARKIVGTLASHEGFLGFYGKNPVVISSGACPIPEHTEEEVNGALWRLRKEGLLDFTFSGCGPNVYCFQGENIVSKSTRFSGYMESRFKFNTETRIAIANFLKAEFPTESLMQELYSLEFKVRTTDLKLKLFDMEEIAGHYARKLNVKPISLDDLRYGKGCYGNGFGDNAQRIITEHIKTGKPLMILDARSGSINLLTITEGKRIKLLGLTYGVIHDYTRNPAEARQDLRLMSSQDPSKDEFLGALIKRYDNPQGQKFNSSVDLKKIGFGFKDPRYVLEQITGSGSGIVHQFTV